MTTITITTDNVPALKAALARAGLALAFDATDAENAGVEIIARRDRAAAKILYDVVEMAVYDAVPGSANYDLATMSDR